MYQHQRRPQPLNLAFQWRLLQLRKERHGRSIDESVCQPRPIGKDLSGGQLSNDHVWKVVICVSNVREHEIQNENVSFWSASLPPSQRCCLSRACVGKS